MDSEEGMGRQFSLRSFLLGALLTGALLGLLAPVWGPILFRWAPGPATPSHSEQDRSHDRFESSTTYFESGETPLN